MGTMTARQPSSHRLNQVIILPMYTVKFGALKMCCKMAAVSTRLAIVILMRSAVKTVLQEKRLVSQEHSY